MRSFGLSQFLFGRSKRSRKEYAIRNKFESWPLRDKVPSNNLVSVTNTIKAKECWKGSTGLRTVATEIYRFEATDPRNLIYAFLGSVDDSGIKPDYSPEVTLHDVLIKVAQQIIRHEKKLDILEDALTRSGEYTFRLPGQVPDWTAAPSRGLKRPVEINPKPFKSIKASGSKEASVQCFERDNGTLRQVPGGTSSLGVYLQVDGILIDELDNITDRSRD